MVGYLLLQVFLLVSFKVPTNSIVPEIMPGDFILVEKLSMGPRLFNVFKATRLEDVEIYRQSPGEGQLTVNPQQISTNGVVGKQGEVEITLKAEKANIFSLANFV